MDGDSPGGNSCDAQPFLFRAGDHVALADDDWQDLGHDIVLIDAEPVPGSTQCLVTSDGETRTVSRFSLRQL